MEIKVGVEDLGKVKLFIATPMYGGQCYGLYMKSCLDLQHTLLRYGVEARFSFLFNESLITRARNYLVDEFMRSECTHLLFLDSDIMYDSNDIITMIVLDKDVIGGPYPKKTINWNNIKKAITNNPDIPNSDLENIVGEYVFNPVKGTTRFAVSEPLEVLEIGTGFMMVKREVFEKLKAAFPQLHYKPDHIGHQNFDGSRYIHAFFDTVVDSDDSIIGGGSDRYLSEDYFFCQLWRKIGGSITLCPWMLTKHIGSYAYTGNMPAVAHYTGEL